MNIYLVGNFLDAFQNKHKATELSKKWIQKLAPTFSCT